MTRILAYRFSAFGDVAILVPVLKEFLAQNPSVEIVFVSQENFQDLFNGIDRLTFKGIDLASHSGILRLRKLTNELEKTFKPKYIADIHTAFLAYLPVTFRRLRTVFPVLRLAYP